jgi:starch phosphorylase
MEIALRSEIPTYAGGLGILAGDTLRTGADLKLPLVGITLISRMGYFHQEIDASGQQTEQPDPWIPEEWLLPLDAKIAVPIGNRKVWVQAWLYTLENDSGHQIPVILLDTDLTENESQDREITHYLYGKGEEYRLRQEIVLGIGGARMLHALGFRINTYHMNEGHSALLAVELLHRFEHEQEMVCPGDSTFDVTDVKERCLFTTHTPVESGHDKFSYELVEQLLDDYIDINELRKLAGNHNLNMTRLALNLSGYVNGVAKAHAKLSNSMFPGYHVHAITNGIHPPTWAHASFSQLYDQYLPEWRYQPELLLRADQLPDEEIWQAHCLAKQDLIDQIRKLTGTHLHNELPIIGFARRMTGYKRPDLLFSDLDRLIEIAHKYPFQIVLSGKSHPQDDSGKQLIHTLHKHISDLSSQIPVVYLPNYNMDVALSLVSGSDLWLNTPLRPMEASGTSGMKAALNGVPNLSILDGWWIEGCIEGVTGWAIGTETNPESNGSDASHLYEKLQQTVLPLFHQDRAGWLQVMKGAISKNASYFNSHFMMRRYAAEAYMR